MDNKSFTSVNDLLPLNAPDLWSRDVVVRTNLGNIYLIAFCSGSWQRLFCFEKNEIVVEWQERKKDNLPMVKIETPLGEMLLIAQYEDFAECHNSSDNRFYFYNYNQLNLLKR